MKTVSRAYDTYAQARAAVAAVEAAVYRPAEVSLVANKYVSAQYADVDDVNKTATGAGIGGVVGGGAGLLAGLGLLAIPGLGPVVAAAGWRQPPLAWPRVPAGGLVGALVGAGESEKDMRNVYSESVRRGGTLVTARVADGRSLAFRLSSTVQADRSRGARRRLSRRGGSPLIPTRRLIGRAMPKSIVYVALADLSLFTELSRRAESRTVFCPFAKSA